MLNIPVANPRVAQVITILAGIAAVLVAQLAPTYSPLLAQILTVLGIGAVGVGGASFTGKVPPAAPMLMLLFAGLCLPLTACAPMTPAKWAKLGACADVLEQPLLNEVAAVLAGDGDVGAGLLAIVQSGQAQEAVECAVAQLASDIGKQPADAKHARIRARAQDFLATKVPQ